MKSLLAAAAATLLSAPRPADAQDAVSGHWSVSGRVPGFAFTLNCKFQHAGQGLGGVCIDGSTTDPKVKGGRRHIVTKGQLDGDHISWSYQSSFLLTHFNVDYTGILQGDHMSGQISVAGRSGTFSADRTTP